MEPESEPATVGNLPGDGAPPYPTYGGALDASGRYMVTVKFGRTPVLHEAVMKPFDNKTDHLSYIDVTPGNEAVVYTSSEMDWDGRRWEPGSKIISTVTREGAPEAEFLWVQHALGERYPGYGVSVHPAGHATPFPDRMFTATICLFQEPRPVAEAAEKPTE